MLQGNPAALNPAGMSSGLSTGQENQKPKQKRGGQPAGLIWTRTRYPM
jgi:hypothetical protein